MATITTFSTLKTAVADWLDRDDMSTSGGPIDVMIELAEDQIYRDLRLRFMESSTAPAISSGVVPIPSDFLELKNASAENNGASTRLTPKGSDWIYDSYPTRSADGIPKFIAQEGDNFIFGPYPDSGYTVNLHYYARPTALSTSNETNWLTTNASDVLLNGALLQSIGYLGADERAAYWQSSYAAGINRLKAQQRRERFPSEMSLRMTPA